MSAVFWGAAGGAAGRRGGSGNFALHIHLSIQVLGNPKLTDKGVDPPKSLYSRLFCAANSRFSAATTALLPVSWNITLSGAVRAGVYGGYWSSRYSIKARVILGHSGRGLSFSIYK